MDPQVFSGVFSAMFMITGQYYMTQINNNLSQIEEGVAAIQKFLEDDKKSQLESEEEFLKQVQQMLPFILDNESQIQSTITSIRKIKIDTLASINFYKKQINDLKDIDVKKDKVYGNAYVFITQALIDVVANVAASADKKAKNKKKNEAYEYLLNGNIGSDIKAIECRQSELTLFESLYNGQLELVKDKEICYIFDGVIKIDNTFRKQSCNWEILPPGEILVLFI